MNVRFTFKEKVLLKRNTPKTHTHTHTRTGITLDNHRNDLRGHQGNPFIIIIIELMYEYYNVHVTEYVYSQQLANAV